MKKKGLEDLLSVVLTKDQVQALREEIVSGARRLHRVVDDNERARVRRDELLALMRRIDDFIEKKDSSPLFLRTMYSAVKEQVKKAVMPMLEEILREAENEGLDAVPPAKSAPKAAAGEPRSSKPGPAEEQGERRPDAPRRRRRPRRRPGARKEGGVAPSNADAETE